MDTLTPLRAWMNHRGFRDPGRVAGLRRGARWAFRLALAAVCITARGALAAAPEDVKPFQSARSAGAATAPIADWGARRSYAIPALEIVGFDLLLNQFDRHYFGGDTYDSSLASIRRNLRSGWVVDNDPFGVNQLGHPYQGAMYHGFARSAGLDFKTSLAYDFAGSLFWEIAGETTRPSRNDQIASGIGGSFLGEPLFRMSNLLLETGGGLSPFWREAAAAAISPSTGFNRVAFGERFGGIFPSHNPTYYSRLQIGVSGALQDLRGASTRSSSTEVLTEFSMDYGLPGRPGYRYERPFDYFTFQAAASSASGFESLSSRGLLVGRDYEAGKNGRGVWGLFGAYDYLSPQTFRISTTALALGTNAQWWLSDAVALQGTAMGGVGYAAVGTLHGRGERDYHYGVAPQATLMLRLIFGDRASLDLAAREYFVTGVGSADTGGHDDIIRGEAGFTWRLYRQNAIALKYLWSRRDARFPDLGDRTQTRGTLGIYYTLLGDDRFGAYDWRE